MGDPTWGTKESLPKEVKTNLITGGAVVIGTGQEKGTA